MYMLMLRYIKMIFSNMINSIFNFHLFLIIFYLKASTIICNEQQGTDETVVCTSLFTQSNYTASKYCYYWLAMDFGTAVNYNSNDHAESFNAKHLLELCSTSKNDELYGFTYSVENFPIILNSTLNNLTQSTINLKNEEKVLRYVDAIFFCRKGNLQINDNNGAMNFITSSFYHKLLADYYQLIISPSKNETINNIRAECLHKGNINTGDSCIAIIEGKANFIPHFDVGLFHMHNLAQFEASNLIKNYFPQQKYESFPIDYLALGNKLFCGSKYIVAGKNGADKYFDHSECVTLSTPDFYYQLCCCDEKFKVCGTLKDDLKIDLSQPIFLIKDSLDEPNKLAKYGLDEKSIRKNYQNKLDERYRKKPQIVCAIGTLRTNETLNENRLINEAFPANVSSCRSIYRYTKKIGEEYKMTIEMNIAFGCTLAKKTEIGYHYCQFRGLICPKQETLPESAMTVECCCEGKHLCNHDMYSYRAFYLLPIYMEVSFFFF
uniref:Uncharacterized protein n=1 Tax=Wuchereria bancrofti TaxID=6293 RepID=A0AAF5PSG0_WUCBA